MKGLLESYYHSHMIYSLRCAIRLSHLARRSDPESIPNECTDLSALNARTVKHFQGWRTCGVQGILMHLLRQICGHVPACRMGGSSPGMLPFHSSMEQQVTRELPMRSPSQGTPGFFSMKEDKSRFSSSSTNCSECDWAKTTVLCCTAGLLNCLL